jgi:AcrR family transcriptional regulator
MPKARARQEAQKVARRRDILAIAAEMIAEVPFQAIAMAEVAERAGLAKGTLYLYFPTKEALFLALLEESLQAWFDDFNAQLAAQPAGISAAALARLAVRSFTPHPLVPGLLGILHAVLEQNVPIARVLAFKEALLGETAATGALLEARLPYLAAGQGARLILRINALVVGLQQMAAPGPALAQAMREAPALAALEVNFAEELEATLAALLTGMERTGGDHEPRLERKIRAGDGRFERPWG